MDKPKKITGWSCSLYWNGHDFLATVQCETKEGAVEVFEEFFSRRINPEQVKETITFGARNRVVQDIAGECEEYLLCKQGWA